MGLRGYIARRTIYTIILIFFCLTLNFILFRAMPGDPAALVASAQRLRREQVEMLRKMWGLDQPLHIQYIRYLQAMLTFHFGISYHYRKPAAEMIMLRLPNTLLLLGVSTLFSIIVGIVLGIKAAASRGSAKDVGLVTMSLFTFSLPVFWIGLLFIYVFGYVFGLFPIRGTMSADVPNNPILITFDILWHLFLPALALFLIMYGQWVLLTRNTLLDVLTEDYIITARAKGLPERKVLYKHALRNAMLPLVTNMALALSSIVSGAILTETVFSWHGIGLLTWDAIGFSDYPMLEALFYIFALATILGNFIVDIIYGLIDPRIKY